MNRTPGAPHIIWHWSPFTQKISLFFETGGGNQWGEGLPPQSPTAYELEDLRGSTDKDKNLKLSVSYVLSDNVTSFTAMILLSEQVSSASIIFHVIIFRIWFLKTTRQCCANWNKLQWWCKPCQEPSSLPSEGHGIFFSVNQKSTRLCTVSLCERF